VGADEEIANLKDRMRKNLHAQFVDLNPEYEEKKKVLQTARAKK